MNIAQIENNISNLINNFSKENYIYDLLLAYGIPKNTITLLKKGKRNLSKRDDQLILKKKILFQEVISEDPHLIIDLIANEKESYRHDPRFIIVTNYKELLAIDTKTKETLDIDVKDFDKNFVFFLPLAGMEKTQHKNENPADVKAAEKMAKIYDEILKENDFKTDANMRELKRIDVGYDAFLNHVNRHIRKPSDHQLMSQIEPNSSTSDKVCESTPDEQQTKKKSKPGTLSGFKFNPVPNAEELF